MRPDLDVAGADILFGAGDLLGNAPLLEGCGALLFESFRALLFLVLSVGVVVMLWRAARHTRRSGPETQSGATA